MAFFVYLPKGDTRDVDAVAEELERETGLIAHPPFSEVPIIEIFGTLTDDVRLKIQSLNLCIRGVS